MTKVPIVARINVSRQSSYQPTDGREDRDYESEDYPEESSDEPANIMEMSLDIADELKITITEVDDMIDSQQLDNSKTVAGKEHPSTRKGFCTSSIMVGGSTLSKYLIRTNTLLQSIQTLESVCQLGYIWIRRAGLWLRPSWRIGAPSF